MIISEKYKNQNHQLKNFGVKDLQICVEEKQTIQMKEMIEVSNEKPSLSHADDNSQQKILAKDPKNELIKIKSQN